MASVNIVTIVGNVTRDIELRYTAGGTAVCDLSLAINDKRKDARGEWVEEVTFVECVCWGRTAEIASEYLSKGSNVLIEGKLKQDSWEDKATGQKRTKLKVVAERMQMLGGKPKDDSGNGSANRAQYEEDKGRQEQEPARYQRQVDESDIPF